jgi:hypothetical protein
MDPPGHSGRDRASGGLGDAAGDPGPDIPGRADETSAVNQIPELGTSQMGEPANIVLGMRDVSDFPV